MHPYHVEAYRYLRDHAKPISQRDAADLREIRAPQPPSRAHVCRLKRDRSRYRDHPRDYPVSPVAPQMRVRNDFLKEQMALLGGTRAVAPAYPPLYPRPESAWRYVPVPRNAELYPEPKPYEFMSEERACTIVRDHLVEQGRMGHEVDMFYVLRVFGSFDKFRRAVENVSA